MMIIHRTSGILLLIFHLLFLARSWQLLRQGGNPTSVDRLLMLLSQILLPVTIITGIPVIRRTGMIHVILGVMPVAMMFILSRKSLRRKHPLLLPLINGLFISAALFTAFLL